MKKIDLKLWNPQLTLVENAKLVRLSTSYAYALAAKNNLKFRGPCKTRIPRLPSSEPQDPYLPSAQIFAWDECPENYLNSEEQE